MVSLLLSVSITTLAVLAVARFLPGFSVADLYAALLVAVVLGILNIFVRPILFILTLPINIITLGLFSYVLNAFMLLMAASLVSGITIDGFLPAFIGAFIITLTQSLVSRIE